MELTGAGESYPLPGVTVRQVSSVKTISHPLYSDESKQVSQDEFNLIVPGIGSFYAGGGTSVEYHTDQGADPEWVKLYLNNQVLVALLHQRGIISFHASSFIRNGCGVMILGESRAGKSSLTASFVLKGAGFLTDDTTPVIIRDQNPYIMSLFSAIRIRKHTVGQLNISPENLTDAEPGTGKHYMKVGFEGRRDNPLDYIFQVEVGNNKVPEFFRPSPTESFSILRSEICFWEVLRGMPSTEAGYLHQLLGIVNKAGIVRVVRPADIRISELQEAVGNFLDQYRKCES